MNRNIYKTKLPHRNCTVVYKLWFCLTLFIGMLLLFPLSVNAKETTIHNIDIVVSLNQDGSADITENWNVTVSGITEWYLVQGSLGKIEIQNFSVSDETGRVYEYEGAWDIDRSLEEKAGKCGIVDKGDGSYELCWGVGSDGDHLFSASYHMTNFIKRFDDYCAFNQRLVNDDLSSPPQSVFVTMLKSGTEFTTEDVGAWGFGFNGTIAVNDGVVSAKSNQALGRSDYVTIMCRFPRQMFDTTNVVDGSFLEMQNQAFKGSDYETGTPMSLSLFLIRVSAAILTICFFIVYLIKKYKINRVVTSFEDARREEQTQENRKFYGRPIFWVACLVLFAASPFLVIGLIIIILYNHMKKPQTLSTNLTGAAYPVPMIRAQMRNYRDYCRDIPLECKIPAIYYACSQTWLSIEQNNVIGAYLLKWLQTGNIEIREEKKERGLGIRDAQAPSIILKSLPAKADEGERRLYHVLEQASGENHILQEKEMYHWAVKNYSSITGTLQAISDTGEKFLKDAGYLGFIPAPGLLHLYRTQKTVFTEPGREQMLRLKGIKNFLKDFTIIDEREPQDVILWDQYLITAQLFGIADKVAEKFKAIYPDYFTDHASYYTNYAGSYAVISSISKAGISGANSGSSSTSSGGGGGSSGGGSGGGGR